MAMRKKNKSLLLPLPAILLFVLVFATVSCTCGGSTDDLGSEGEFVDDLPSADDDGHADDDSSTDDDTWPDDDDSSTTTTVPATTTTTAGSTTTTTTVVTTTTTSTTIPPGSGTACDPYNVVPEYVSPAVPYGPWPEWERDGVVFQQIVSSGAGFGQNDITVSSDGVVHAVVQDGLSLDHLMIDAAGTITRETINPLGGEWKMMAIDNDDHVHLVYTYRPDPTGDVTELRYATNASGAWVDGVVRAVDREDPDFDITVDAGGVVHLVYTGVAHNDTRLYYGTITGGVLHETQLAPDDVSWRVGCYIALDSAGEPHVIATDPSGLYTWNRDGGGAWVKTLVNADQEGWDLLIDAQDRWHVASYGKTDEALYYGLYDNGAWTWEEIDECRNGIWYAKIMLDAEGHRHFIYTDGYALNVYYATDKTGSWVYTHLRDSSEFPSHNANDMSSTIDQDGHIHVVHRRDLAYSRVFYSTDRFGGWRTTAIAGTHDIQSESGEGIVLKDDALHFALVRDHYRRVVYAKLENGAWSESEIYSTSAPTGGMPVWQDISIAVGADNLPQIIWANKENEQLMYSRLIDGAWVDEIIESGTSFTMQRMALGGDGDPIVAYRGGSGGYRFAKRAGTEWQVEYLSFAPSVQDLAIDQNGLPTIMCSLGSDEVAIGKRISQDNWETEFVTDQDQGSGKIIIDQNDDLHLFHTGNWGSYSTDITGSWTTEQLEYGLWFYSGVYVDEAPNPHIITSIADGYPEWNDDAGLIYGVKNSQEWTWYPVFMSALAGFSHAQFLNQLHDGYLIAIYSTNNTETNLGIFSAKFSPSIIDN